MDRFIWNKLSLQKTVLILIAILGVMYIFYTWESTKKDEFDQARQIEISVVALLPLEDLKALEANPDDIFKPQYKVLKNALKLIINDNTKARAAYIYIERNGKIYFVADSESENSPDYSPPGQEFTESKPVHKHPLKNERNLIAVSEADRWGVLTSVHFPIKDTSTGNTIAVFGMDFNPTSWDNYLILEVAESSVLISLLLLAIFFLFKIMAKNRLLRDDIGKLNRSKDELKKQKDDFEMIFNLVPAQIWFKDTHNRIIRANQNVYNNLGLTENEIIGHTAEELFPSFAQRYFEDDREIINSRIPKLDTIEQYSTASGEHRWAHIDKFPVFGKNDDLIGIVVFSQDITERKLSEMALQNTNRRLKTLLDTIPDLIWIKDREGIYTGCNKMFERYFGAKEADIIGKTDYDFVDRELADYFHKCDRKAMKAGKPTRNEDRIVFADDGHPAYLDTIKSPMYDSEGTIIGVLGIGRDLTERKKVEDELIESEKKYRSIFENVQDVFYQINISGIITEISPSIKYSFEFSRDEMIGTSVINLYNNPADREIFLNELMKNGEVRNYELELKTKTNKIKFASVNASLIFDPEGIPIQISGAFRDITEHKNAREENFMLAQSLKSINECLCITDLEDRIHFVNDSFLKTYGYEKNELIGKKINIVRSRNNVQEKVKQILPATIQGEWQGELINKRKDGSEFLIFLSTSIVKDHNNKALGLIGVATDITDRKHFEMQLIEAKEHAEESDRLKSAFLANMSHEIRTPMNGILGFAELLKEPHLSGDEQQEYISIIEKSGARMLNIINDIINISKVQSGLIEVSDKETNINEQIEYIYSFFKPEAEHKGIQLRFINSLPSKKANIKTDREKIYAILTNLVKNALKFTNAGIIEFGYKLKSNGDLKELEFYVKDTGAGIPKEHQEYIFERFRQGSEALNRKYEGAGLGLTIAKAYVEILGGKIWVESEDGKGSTFYFTIPYNRESDKEKDSRHIESGYASKFQIKNLKILIAEDDETSEFLISRFVKSFSREILTARTGVEAVEICRNKPDIDLVLIDIRLPKLDGYESTRQIRQFNPNVVIIAQTAFALSGDREKAIAAGCNDYIAKPFGLSLLKSLLEKQFKY